LLRFQTKPDAVFLDLLHEAIEFTINDINDLHCDPEAFEIQYEKSSRLFHPQLGRDTLQTLLEASRSPQWYQLTDYHWLLLYEALEVYCGFFNDDEGRGFRVFEQYGIRQIEFDAIVDMFFWDTDFLLPGDEMLAAGMEGRQQLAIGPETFGLTQGLKPHPEELQLRPVEVDEKTMPPIDRYRPGSDSYPSCEES
jgi:hypothetical protein